MIGGFIFDKQQAPQVITLSPESGRNKETRGLEPG
jgi:hypothetical protein